MFAIGDDEWPGLSKLTEEAGEVCQVIGKLMGTGGEVRHWDGTYLGIRLEEEMGDLLGAIKFVLETCDELSEDQVVNRAQDKLELFRRWHKEQED